MLQVLRALCIRSIHKGDAWRYRLTKQVAKAEEALNKLKVTKNSKEELKTVALGTSKINYLDPRITVAWCKRKDVPLEKIFNKSLLGKFTWAMEVSPEFAF
jgi:DNA topoisomerase I